MPGTHISQYEIPLLNNTLWSIAARFTEGLARSRALFGFGVSKTSESSTKSLYASTLGLAYYRLGQWSNLLHGARNPSRRRR